MLPYCKDPSEFKNPDVAQNNIDGPQGFITIIPNGVPQMGSKMLMSFVYYLFSGVLCAFFVNRTGAPEGNRHGYGE